MENQPIVVKKIKKGGHGHHGGAWKVAFADFVTAMMAFFLLLWLLGSTTPEQKAAIADFFNNPSAIQAKGGASDNIINMDTMDNKRSDGEGKEKEKSKERPLDPKTVQMDKMRLETLKMELEMAIESSEALKKFKDQLLLDITPEGLRIQIIDKEKRPMFSSGGSRLKDYTKEILHEIAKVIDKVPNKISLTGHTDATPYANMMGYTNWELSADRANASRRELVFGGLREGKIAKVVGLASTVLFDKENPRAPINRRISMIVMNKQAERALAIEELGKMEPQVQTDYVPEPRQLGGASSTSTGSEAADSEPRPLTTFDTQPRSLGGGADEQSSPPEKLPPPIQLFGAPAN